MSEQHESTAPAGEPLYGGEIWIEKYRPRTLDEVVGQDEIIERLKSYVRMRNLPHLLFSGPPGVGKTASAICIARELFGEGWQSNFIELNASDERGIDIVRNKIKNFARTSPLGDAEFKIIFLDEADALTADAQSALRRTMEMYTKTCRFILSCNYSSKIIEPIQSRCAVYRFKPLSDEAISRRLRYVAQEEGIELTESALGAIVYLARGDMRRALNALQAAAMLGNTVDEQSVWQVASAARPEEVHELVRTALSGDFRRAREQLDHFLMELGLSGEDVLIQIYRALGELNISERLKVELMDHIGEIDFRMSEGANERIQLDALLAHFVWVGTRSKGTRSKEPS
ncbi:replication factor C small subunit [Methermicoccus shengliensis]|uniref:Replication factor C small subunit n=1 Tax=Methermicoccus shengliensis TaxID=660064 RepID=A0A832VWS8_9EURY|nr:replication factor C small subunit [Methermicoccus shengliensis]KUK05172.1 MAG: Replication factor C small subunit [Euryarchaeota archaeon 55_53]KUK30738.1 MAG: Replication factor C small subunit [Methanosarcinales archeaon 56_1174]MDI3487332.1 replication factor small subunit [Methanosarcinales archaeon]MDN5294594.1 replication factor small subunit [Methanosarcinales archaeon]HIH69302.1 replication factor C small subunit [Methermicoccus shengliensis]